MARLRGTEKRPLIDPGYHDRRLAATPTEEDLELREEFEHQRREIAAIDAIVDELDALRENRGMSKAELARAIGKNPAAIRRLLSASSNPELRTVFVIADVLGAEVQIVSSATSTSPSGAGPVERRRAA